jgi:hypothetical protein
VRVRVEDADQIVEIAGQIREREAEIHGNYADPGYTVAQMRG